MMPPFPAPVDAPALPPWAAVLASYLLGALPFGFLMARAKGIDLRKVGSGNIGATNAMRALGRPLGVTAFLLDFGKGWLPVAVLAPLAVGAASEPGALGALRLACGAAAVLGHCFPVYLGFRGGKGVATGCGAVVAWDPLVWLAGGLVWALVWKLSHYVGLASLAMGATFPLVAALRHGDPWFTAGCGLLALLILVRHRGNIARMLQGTEPKSGVGREERHG
jgi:glycerol-3-phosphate acyltransferase PlsY